MVPAHQQKLLTLWHHLNSQTSPRTRDEALSHTAWILEQAFGEVRVLFYLKTFVAQTTPLELLPCPARPLAPNVFVYDGSRCKNHFAFETGQFCYLPLTLTADPFGCLFLERKNRPFDDPAQMIVVMAAAHLVRYLDDLGDPGLACACQPEASVLLKLDPSQRQVWVAGEPLYMREKEFLFLQLLQQWYERGQPCPRKLLAQTIYADEAAFSHQRDRRLDSMASRLREKLARASGGQIQLKAVSGIGYRLCLQPASF